MASGWAVASAAALALALAHVVLDVAANREAVGAGATGHPGGLPSANGALLALVAVDVALFGAWAYALALAAHGEKGALAALLAYALLWSFGQGGLTILVCPPLSDCAYGLVGGVVHVANLVVGAAASWSLFREFRARRGRVQWGGFLGLTLPLLLAVLLRAYLGS
ncbi:MAG TPA: hypothetical protein VHH36_01030 [Candidatus Thermoplasmatota archaeon]|nr:hypothetical protein [Candidatus Thermoplasmatota archaeon]